MSTTNIISLNQIVDLFQSFSERHYFLNDFGFGQTSEIGTSRQMDFPYMWVTLNDDSLINPQNRTAIPELSFSVLFMDKTNIQTNYLDINGVNSDNVQEVLSDMLQVLQDFVTEVQVEWGNYGIIFQDTISCYPGIDETQDKVNGWVGQFSFKLKHSNCILPTGDIVQTNLSPINPMTRYLTCDTLSNCQVIQDIQNELASLTGTTSGLTCETLSGCSIIQDIQTEISNFTDVYVTGGTYNNGTSIFRNNTGGTFNVTGYYTGGTSNGLFAQTSDGTPVTATIVETPIIGGGVGTLSVPANGFVVGDSFTAFIDGRISCVGTATLHIHVKTLGGVILADTGVIAMDAATNKNWKLDIQFTIRTLGGVGVASISSGGLFGYVKNSGNNYEGFVLSTVNNTTFDTTISNTLVITAMWNTTNAGNSIFTRNFTLTKTY